MPKPNKTITFSAFSAEHKAYLQKIAKEKGYSGAGDMSRVALHQMFTRMKISFTPESHVTVRDNPPGGKK